MNNQNGYDQISFVIHYFQFEVNVNPDANNLPFPEFSISESWTKIELQDKYCILGWKNVLFASALTKALSILALGAAAAVLPFLDIF